MVWSRHEWKEAVLANGMRNPVLEQARQEQFQNSYVVAPYNCVKVNAYCSHTKQENMTCSCGEEEKDFAWVWSTKDEGGQAGSIVLGPECRQINFNPEYSSGTAAVRGNKLLPTGCHHYWELKMTSAVYGTNIMVGVCTPNFDMKHGVHRFCSLLGRDQESWGYSYTGTIQHAAKFSRYGPRWGKGSIVGIHLDTWRGTLEFFLNREPLGIAFIGLQNKELYPIVASTSAHSGMKLVSSHMFPHTLQFLSSEAVYKKFCKKANIHPEDLALPPGLQSYVQKNYWPFIKFVSLRSGDNRLEYIRVCNSKRPHEDDSADVKRSKRVYAHLLHNPSTPHISPLEVRSDSSSESSSSGGANSLSGHQCFHMQSSSDSFSTGRESPPAHRCFKVLFDLNASTQPSSTQSPSTQSPSTRSPSTQPPSTRPPSNNLPAASTRSSSDNLTLSEKVEDASTINTGSCNKTQSTESSTDKDW